MAEQLSTIDTTRTAGAVPEGVHRFQVVDFEEKIGPAAPYWSYTLEVQEDSPFDGQSVWANISLSAKARWKLEEFLDAMQIQEGMKLSGDTFLGQYVRGDVVHDEYETTPDEGNKETRKRVSIATFLPDAVVKNPGKAKPSKQEKAPKQEETPAEDVSNEVVEEATEEKEAVKRPF